MISPQRKDVKKKKEKTLNSNNKTATINLIVGLMLWTPPEKYKQSELTHFILNKGVRGSRL